MDDPWWLLELVFWLHFWPEADEDPLVSLDKLSAENLAFLRAIFLESRDAEIRSRLGDILWLVSGDRKALGIAIDAYLESGFGLEDPAHWARAIERYRRAAELAADLKRKSLLRRRIGEFLLDRLRFYEGKDRYYFTEQALEILFRLRTVDLGELYRRARAAAESAPAGEDSRRARACYAIAVKISRLLTNEAARLATSRAIAETWVEEGERLEAAKDFLAVRYVWRKAISAYRRLGDEARAAELRQHLKHAKTIGRREMRRLSTKRSHQKSISQS